MNNKVNYQKEFRCNLCDKVYSSASSLCNHNKKFHNENVQKCSINVQKCSINVQKCSINVQKCSNNVQKCSINKSLTCEHCNKIFNNRSTKSMHKKICQNTTNDYLQNTTNDYLQNTVLQLQLQIDNIIKEKGTLHHKTLQKINKLVTNTINNTNNGTIINNTFVKFGNVSYDKIFNEKQLLSILNKQYMSLEEGITKTHFNDKLPEYSNIFITNLKDPLSYIFNGKSFITVKKHNMLDELMDCHINEINLTYEKMKNKIIPKHADRIQKFLTKLNDIDTKYKDPDNDRIYSNYKAYKMDAIKLAIYNNSDKKKLEVLKNIKLIEKIDDDDTDDTDIDL